MRKRFLSVLAAVALFVTLLPMPTRAGDAGDVSLSPRFGQTEARAMLNLINDFRTGDEAFYWNETNTATVSSKGEPLTYSYALEEIAMRRAAEIALSFSHTRPDNTSCFTARASDGTRSWGENIAAGNSTASATFQQWREDDDDYAGQGHRRNMLAQRFRAVGVGHVTLGGAHYWVQEFSDSADSMPPTEAADTERAVTVTVSPARLQSVGELTAAANSVELRTGERAAMPVVSASVRLSDAWPGRETVVETQPVWTSADASVCAVEGQEASGAAAGSTTLTGAAFGKSVSVAVTVVGDGGNGGGETPEPAGGVYAILYDDGTLVFQDGDAPEPGRAVTETYEVDLDAVYLDYTDYSAHTPWYKERKSIRAADFASVLRPASTAAWFCGCENMERVDNIQNLDTAGVTNMDSMFAHCNRLTELDVSRFETANVTDMGGMFFRCYTLTELDVSGFHTANVTDMNSMFAVCGKLTELDVSRFETARVTDMEAMFCNCGGLTELDVSGFHTASVTNMSNMFSDCGGLTELDVSGFETANVTDMSNMFSFCGGLTELDVSSFDTASVTDMNSMFAVCGKLTELDVSHFDTANVTDMTNMFWLCDGLTTLDVSSFDTANVKAMPRMFAECAKLETIYASDKFTAASVPETEDENSNYMFLACASLVGGGGTRYDGDKTDAAYARIDAPSAPGYFTAKNGAAYAVSGARDGDKYKVTLTNPGPVTVIVAHFDADGRFLSADIQRVEADAGSVSFPLTDASASRVMLLDGDCRPLCVAG